jgi:DUF4097 and DUF4098 domain-containing protein YvlB
MNTFQRSILTALGIAIGVHAFCIGLLRDVLPRETGAPLVHENRTLRFAEGKFLRLAHSDGSVEVFTHDQSEFMIKAAIRAYGPDKLQDVARDYIATMVTGVVDGGGIRIQTEAGERPEPLDVRTDYVLTVPRGTNVSVEGVNGNVLIHEGCGALFINGNNTDIKIVGPGAAVRAQSNNGRIKVEAPGETVLKTINGNIYARMRGGYLTAETTNGTIKAVLSNAETSSCDLTSLNGGITLSATDGCALALEARTDNGIVDSALAFNYAEGYPKRRKIVGVLGDGRTRATLYSRNGNVSIARSEP